MQVLNTAGCKILNHLLPSTAAFSFTQPNRLYPPAFSLSQERDNEAPAWLSITRNLVTVIDRFMHYGSLCPFFCLLFGFHPSCLIHTQWKWSSSLAFLWIVPWQVMICATCLLGDPFLPRPMTNVIPFVPVPFFYHNSVP